jgi:hypothetical protein
MNRQALTPINSGACESRVFERNAMERVCATALRLWIESVIVAGKRLTSGAPGKAQSADVPTGT